MHFILSILSMDGFTFCFWLSTFLSIFTVSSAIESIQANGTIADGETIVSAGGDFELGFFDPGNSKRYLGVWYKKAANRTVAWVANRDSPLSDTSGVLQLSEQGILLLSDGSGNLIWSAPNTSKIGVKSPVARLLDTGNFIVTYGENTNTLWQSFDYIGDTLLPEMKLGRDLRTGLERYLLSWKSENDPASGDHSIKLNANGYPQFFVMKGSDVETRWGPWNGLGFGGTPHLRPNNNIFTYEFVYNEDEIYYRFKLVNGSVLSRLQMDPLGVQRRLNWVDPNWITLYAVVVDDCDKYATCGAYGICNIDSGPTCGCLDGFKPKFPNEWGLGKWSHGCVKKLETICGDGETFTRIRRVKLPDTATSWYNGSINLKDCKMLCMKNCSCTAYANQDISGGGSGCLLWFNELMDIRQYSGAKLGQDLYIRIASSELGLESNSFRKKMLIIIITSILIVVLVGFIYILNERRKRKRRFEEEEMQIRENDADDDENQENLDLPVFDFSIIADATDDFSDENKIGEGGYGPVYWGKLKDGQEIAVKRLSKESKQGLSEFKNEVALIAKLQHRNLVKLLGCCIQEKEKSLIYEYLPNKSLDFFIFSQGSSIAMDWSLRCQIINGIARGLLYLHQDSRLRIIHRDLKASNILLDNNMNPKISDFGIAKGIGGDETEAQNTLTVVGTYGYMSPEYIIDGAFSVKSDVFSFGVLLLEIISGRRNRRFQHHGHNHNLLGHAWKLFQEGRSSELIGASVSLEKWDEPQILRYIQVGLLCVQQSPEDRPIMASVVLMLSSGNNLPLPKEPGFFTERQLLSVEEGSSSGNLNSVNQITLTAPTPR